jgi:hypothetical protein
MQLAPSAGKKCPGSAASNRNPEKIAKGTKYYIHNVFSVTWAQKQKQQNVIITTMEGTNSYCRTPFKITQNLYEIYCKYLRMLRRSQLLLNHQRKNTNILPTYVCTYMYVHTSDSSRRCSIFDIFKSNYLKLYIFAIFEPKRWYIYVYLNGNLLTYYWEMNVPT